MTADDLLQRHSLRRTRVRRAIVEHLLAGEAAATAAELEAAADADRVTAYRTLRTFEEAGVIHRIHDAVSGGEKFSLCGRGCGPAGHDHHRHAHFSCESCGRTECVGAPAAEPAAALPPGYSVSERILTYVGRCAACATPAAA